MPPRFFVDAPLAVSAAPVPLPAAVAHHATRVLRLGAGDPLVLFDGSGGENHETDALDNAVSKSVELGVAADRAPWCGRENGPSPT